MLLYAVIIRAFEIGGEEGQEIVVSLTAGKVCLRTAERLYGVEYGDFGALCGSRHGCLGSVAVRHQTVIEEIAQIPVLTERARSEIFQIVDVHVAGEVVIRKFGRHLEEILLLTDFVGFLLVRSFGVFLKIRVVLCAESSADVYQMRIIDGRSHSCRDIPVLGHVALKEHYIENLADKRTREEFETEFLYSLLDRESYLFGGGLVDGFAAVELFD